MLWDSYRETHSEHVKRQLALRYSGVVKGVLRTMSLRTAPPLEEQDLFQIGYIGLDDAIGRYDPRRGVKFETYAQLRIRGMIVDELRKLDWVPRTVREQVTRYRRTEERLQRERCGEATSVDILATMAAAGHGVDGMGAMGYAFDVVSLQAKAMMGEDGESAAIEERLPAKDDDVLTVLIRDETRHEILRIMRALPEPQCSVLELYYFDGIAFQDIAILLGVSGARVSQIHKKAITAMREKLRDVVN